VLATLEDFAFEDAWLAHLMRKTGVLGLGCVCGVRGETDERSLLWFFLLAFCTEMSSIRITIITVPQLVNDIYGYRSIYIYK